MLYDEIKKIAIQKKISIRKIETSLDMKNGTLRKWNKSEPSVFRLKKVADFLNVDLNTLVSLSYELEKGKV